MTFLLHFAALDKVIKKTVEVLENNTKAIYLQQWCNGLLDQAEANQAIKWAVKIPIYTNLLSAGRHGGPMSRQRYNWAQSGYPPPGLVNALRVWTRWKCSIPRLMKSTPASSGNPSAGGENRRAWFMSMISLTYSCWDSGALLLPLFNRWSRRTFYSNSSGVLHQSQYGMWR